MDDYINRNELITKLEMALDATRADAKKAEKECNKPFYLFLTGALEAFWGCKTSAQSMKAADVRENVRGEWVEREVFDIHDVSIEEWQSAQCSICGQYHTTPHRYCFKNFNFCPWCGADIRGEKDG